MYVYLFFYLFNNTHVFFIRGFVCFIYVYWKFNFTFFIKDKGLRIIADYNECEETVSLGIRMMKKFDISLTDLETRLGIENKKFIEAVSAIFKRSRSKSANNL